MHRRFQYSLRVLVVMAACIVFATGFAQRWFGNSGTAGHDRNAFVVTVGPDRGGNMRTTVKWGDGRVIHFAAGKIPKSAKDRDGSFTLSGRAVTKAERRQFEQDHGLLHGALNRD